MSNKLFFFIFIFCGSALTAQSQVPTLQAVTTQGSTTTKSIFISSQSGLSIVTDPGNSSLITHWLRASPVDPGVMRFDCGSMDARSGWEFYNSNTNKSLLYIRQNPGFIGIGTAEPKARLAVNGVVLAKKVRITPINWADYVFEPSYDLPSLQQLEKFITHHKHLPDIPSAKAVSKDDLNLGESQVGLLRKIEEMTLYLIAQDKKLKEREEYINNRAQALEDRERRLSALEAKRGNK